MIYSLGERKVEFIGENYFIAETAVVIGSVIIHNNVSIWYNAVVRGDYEPITILDDTNIQDGVVIHTDAGIPATIGRGVTVGHQAMLHGSTVGENSLIGINAVLLNNSRIGNNCIIGANCLITQGKVIPDNSMVLGSPGKVVREVTPAEIEDLKSSALHYVNNFKLFKRELRRQDY